METGCAALSDSQIVSSHIDADRLSDSELPHRWRQAVQRCLRAIPTSTAGRPFGVRHRFQLAQLGQAKHVQLMPRESVDDVLLQRSLLLSPIFTSNHLQLNSHVVEANCQLRRVVRQLSARGLFSTGMSDVTGYAQAMHRLCSTAQVR